MYQIHFVTIDLLEKILSSHKLPTNSYQETLYTAWSNVSIPITNSQSPVIHKEGQSNYWTTLCNSQELSPVFCHAYQGPRICLSASRSSYLAFRSLLFDHKRLFPPFTPQGQPAKKEAKNKLGRYVIEVVLLFFAGSSCARHKNAR